MIYTVTLNPSLDYIVSVKDFRMGRTNRTESEKILPGGKGINVSTILMNLGMENTALGFLAGFTGEEIDRRLRSLGVKSGFIKLGSGDSRINFKLRSCEGTEINGKGPMILEQDIAALLQQIDGLQEGDVLFLAGSIPGGVPNTIYRTICERLADRRIEIVVDATGDLLRNVLEYHPILIKPNHHELGEMFGVELAPDIGVVPYAKRLQALGARNVLVSMAGDGAILVAEDGSIFYAEPPKGTLVNGVGAGDSMVAGFMAGWLTTGDYRKAFHMGVAAGSASAFSEDLATGEEIRNIYSQVISRTLNDEPGSYKEKE